MTNYETTTSIPTYVSLCSGYDGIGIGLKRAIPGLRTIAHVEIETYAIANLISKMEAGLLDACPVFTDLKQFPYEQLRDRVTILSAGFPCQPFSSAGKRRATEDERHLYPYIADGITAMRPRYVLLENVEGIISAKTADGESVLKYVLGDLEERGYRCTWGVFSASETGAPHQRKRVFILAYSASLGRESKSTSGQPKCERLTKVANHDSDGQLAYTTSGESRQSQTRNGGQDIGGGSEEELGDPKHDGSPTAKDGGSTRSEQEEGRMQEPTGRCEQSANELADCKCERHGRRDTSGSSGVDGKGCNSSQEEQTAHDLRSEAKGCCGEPRTRWPARPGEEQYEWEEPRVTEAQSELGGAVDGLTHRVDRLRLLGNGVVPQTAELAWKTLWRKMNEDNH